MGAGAGIYGDRYFECTAPVAGQIANLVVNTTAASVDLATIGQLTNSMNNSDQPPQDNSPNPAGLVGRYVRFEAVGCSIGLSFGNTNAAVSGNNAPNTANTTSTISTSNNNLVSGCVPLASGTYKEWFIHPDTRFVGYVAASSSGSLVISQSSRGM